MVKTWPFALLGPTSDAAFTLKGLFSRPDPFRTMTSHCSTTVRAFRSSSLQLDVSVILENWLNLYHIHKTMMILIRQDRTLIDDLMLVCHFNDVCIRSNTKVTGSLEKHQNWNLKVKRVQWVTFTFSSQMASQTWWQMNHHLWWIDCSFKTISAGPLNLFWEQTTKK